VFFARKYGARLGKKIGSTLAGYFLAGLIGSVLLFTLILSEEIFWYAHYRYTCATLVPEKIYDQRIHDEYEKQYVEGKVRQIYGNEMIAYKKKYPIIDKDVSGMGMDENNVIYYSIDVYTLFGTIMVFKMVDLKTNKLIFESQDHYASAGYLSGLINITSETRLKYGFCSSNKHGAFSDK
jgi:hypothetical protein